MHQHKCVHQILNSLALSNRKCNQNANDQRGKGQESKVQPCCLIPGVSHTIAHDAPCPPWLVRSHDQALKGR